MTLSAGSNLTITQFSFNQIFYNSGDWVPSVSPYLNAFEWNIADSSLTNNIINVESIYTQNQFIMGLKTFTVSTGQATLAFTANIGTYSLNYGVQVVPSIPGNSSLTGLSSSVVSVLYMVNFFCPNTHPYSNLTTQLCQDVCAPYSYINYTDNTCRFCTNPLCLTCS